jgi:hypothetical protein
MTVASTFAISVSVKPAAQRDPRSISVSVGNFFSELSIARQL